MSDYQPQSDDVARIVIDVLGLDHAYAQLPSLAEGADRDLLKQVLEGQGKFVGEVVAPLQRQGDEQGARWHQGEVATPEGFAQAYQQFWQGGWPALSSAAEDGGQGLPAVLEAVLYEWLSAANHAWTMAPGLLHGAYECLKHHGSQELKDRYLSKLATGEWLATMCLTEAHAGSDLGLARTRAVPQAKGHALIGGTKIFISGGEHDLTDNIVHLVLARLPDSPPGPKGLSLFLAPKFLPDGSRNNVVCERIEEKMGLHGSPTCVMRFDEATGWLVGEPGKGLNAMFVMMNAARLHVALQGIGLLDSAWQKAHAYAHERRQMRAPGTERDASQEADLLIAHPAMRRILDTQRAWVDGGRVLAYQTAYALDVAKQHPEAARRQWANQWCAVVTPVLKAAWTNQAFQGANECLQVLGGHGYVREWGIEQIVRDSRVAMIYEGTNEIQAIDLLFRKVLADGGQAMLAVCEGLHAELLAVQEKAPKAVRRGQTALAQLRSLVDEVVALGAQNAEILHPVAGDFLRVTALALLACAQARLSASGHPGYEAGEQAFVRWVLPELVMRQAMVQACRAT